MINRNSLTHYTMIAKLIRASREAMKKGCSTVYNRKGKAFCTIYTDECGRMVVYSDLGGNQNITALVSSVLFD